MLQNAEYNLSCILSLSPDTETEAHRLLKETNDTTAPYPRDVPIHQLFEARTAAAPDAVALAFQEVEWTYNRLNRKSNQLAHYLRRYGVGPDITVGVSIERSPEMIVALLGILKAGGAYLPLDPAAPKNRLNFMVRDADIKTLLTQEHRRSLLPEAAGKVIFLDSDWDAIAEESEENPASEATAESLAYVLFTSGSTGVPKGVMVEHRAVVRLVCNTNYVRLGADEVLLQMAPLAFDASTFEIWGALLNGAKLVLMPPQEIALCDIGQAIVRYRVTTMWLTAGLFHQMVDGPIAMLRPLRQLLAGGDVLGVPQVRKAMEQLPECQIINGYGPTEATTFACCCPVTAEMLDYPSIPIGRPVANTRAYILDENLQPLPVGIAGELYIGGDGVARGYLNRPELSAEKFLVDPFSAEPQARLYRTGDRVQYLPDGSIAFLGRIDQQIKIRGYRIELGEIEAALLLHPAIRTAAVMTQGDSSESKQLVTYVTGENLPSAIALRTFLKEHLPEYSVPAIFWRLATLPLTPNGKVDKNALSACQCERLDSGVVYAAPRSGVEQTVAQIWKEVLDVEKVGLHENFFDIGGDSLRLTQAHSKLEATLGTAIELTALFQYPNVSALANFLHQAGGAPASNTPAPQVNVRDSIADRVARQKDALNQRRQFVKRQS